MAQRRLKLPVI